MFNFDNILVIDDSALMRKFICDIINKISGEQVSIPCANTDIALMHFQKNEHLVIVISVGLVDGDSIKFISQLREKDRKTPIVAMVPPLSERDILVKKLGGYNVKSINRPLRMGFQYLEPLTDELSLALKNMAPKSKASGNKGETAPRKESDNVEALGKKTREKFSKKKGNGYDLVAIASSTGGPQALKILITGITADIDIPVVIVQHMPEDFTASLAERIDGKSKLNVAEAKDGDVLKPNHVYIAKGGRQLKIREKIKGVYTIDIKDDSIVSNLRPCADVMYKSLIDCSFKKILCVVLTGMGCDGTEGILRLKEHKRIGIITQDEKSCVVYGMPKSVDDHGLSDISCDIKDMANILEKELGVL